MSISSALFAGVSGLNTLGNSMAVIGDNIANVNTIGFKSSRSTFETVLAQSIAGASGTSQVGRGVALSAVDPDFSQGSFESTNEATDMAIGGKGFFMVRSEETGLYYTRAGHFRFDEEGYLVNPADYRVQGWILDPDSPDPVGAITDIRIDATSSSPNATSQIDIAANLDSSSNILETGATVSSDENTTQGFVFDDDATIPNDNIRFTEGAATYNASIINDGDLEPGRVYTGTEVASALERAMNNTSVGATNTYTVSYDTVTNTFNIAHNNAAAAAVNLQTTATGSTINKVLGYDTTATTTIAAAGTDAAESREYYISETVNDSFAITVDSNPISGAPVTVRMDEGNYTGDTLERAMEDNINSALAGEGETVTVDVRYDESNPLDRVFRITSSSRGTGSLIDLDPGNNNFLTTINISEYDEVSEGSGFSTGGFTASHDPVRSGFFITSDIGYENHEVNINGTNYDLTGVIGGAASNTVLTGADIAAALENCLLAEYTVPAGDITVTYDDNTDSFTIRNINVAGGIAIDWSNSSAADVFGFDTGSSDTLAQGSSTVSDNARAFNIVNNTAGNHLIELSIDGNEFTGAPIIVNIPVGVYTGQSLANAIETAINTEFATQGESGRVDVTYSDINGEFRIESRELGSESSVQIGSTAGVYPLIDDMLMINDYTVNYGSGFQVEEPDDTANYSTSLSVYDSLGNQHTLSIYFRKATETENTATWEWFAYVPEGDTASGDAEVQARGILSFTNAGILLSQSEVEFLTESGGFDFSGGADTGQEVDIDFGFISGTNVTTQFRAPSSTIYQTQDGYGSGFLQDVSVDPDGVITGNYSNGQVLYLARVSLANFTNPWGLSREGGNNYAETRSSGQPVTTTPGSSGTGSISPNSLEQSNVDLSSEFVSMIIQQRGFQANSRIITTTDSMLQELINLKR